MEHLKALLTRKQPRGNTSLMTSLALALLPTVAVAQNPQANQTMDTVQQRQQAASQSQSFTTNTVPELYPGETSDVGVQSVLRAQAWRPVLEASADVQYFYTDNALYTTHNLQGSDVLVSTIQTDLTTPPTPLGEGFLTPRLGFQQQWYNYGLAASDSFLTYDYVKVGNSGYYRPVVQNLGDLDFSAQTVFLDGAWRWHNWVVAAGVDYRRLLTFPGYDQFYSEVVPHWGVQRLLPLGPTTALSLSYDGNYRVTDTSDTSPGLDSSSGNRTDQSLMLAVSWQLCARAILQPYYRFEYSHYTGINRDDYWNSVGLSLNCPVTRQVNVRVYVAYDNFNTDGAGVQNYQALSAGGGVNLTVAF